MHGTRGESGRVAVAEAGVRAQSFRPPNIRALRFSPALSFFAPVSNCFLFLFFCTELEYNVFHATKNTGIQVIYKDTICINIKP